MKILVSVPFFFHHQPAGSIFADKLLAEKSSSGDYSSILRIFLLIEHYFSSFITFIWHNLVISEMASPPSNQSVECQLCVPTTFWAASGGFFWNSKSNVSQANNNDFFSPAAHKKSTARKDLEEIFQIFIISPPGSENSGAEFVSGHNPSSAPPLFAPDLRKRGGSDELGHLEPLLEPLFDQNVCNP